MTSRTNKMPAGNSRAAYMREYRKRKPLEEDNCNNVPKRKKLHAERQRECRETHKTYLLNTCIFKVNPGTFLKRWSLQAAVSYFTISWVDTAFHGLELIVKKKRHTHTGLYYQGSLIYKPLLQF
jgi:hypothetical protein